MDLYLHDNDPTKTFLITAIGEELYKIETHPRGGGATVVRDWPCRSGSGQDRAPPT